MSIVHIITATGLPAPLNDVIQERHFLCGDILATPVISDRCLPLHYFVHFLLIITQYGMNSYFLTILQLAFIRLSKSIAVYQLALSGIKLDLSVFPLKKDTYSLMSCALYIRVFLLFLVQTVK